MPQPRIIGLWTAIVGVVATAGCLAPAAIANDRDGMAAKGKAIYEQGILLSGAPLVARRSGGVEMRGPNAACITCHQRSGFGLTEGSAVVPPITGPALFQNFRLPTAKPRRAAGMGHVEPHFSTRPAYDDASLSRAVREGVSPTGQRFAYLMPRFDLAGPDMQALIAYLHTLSVMPSPGIETDAINVATVVATDEDPLRAHAMVDVLKACFNEHFPEARAHAKALRLHVWPVHGSPSTWPSQLRAHYASRPVFATVAGLGGSQWQAVHSFCESEQIPCLFANVEVPGGDLGGKDESRYNFYFSKGMVLEAQVAATYLASRIDNLGLVRVVQLRPDVGAGAEAAAALRRALGSKLLIEDRIFGTTTNVTPQTALAEIGAHDAVVIWLSGPELEMVMAVEPPAAGTIIGSTRMGTLEQVRHSAAWRRQMQFVYPFEAPAKLDARMTFNLRPWLAGNGQRSLDERLQGDTLAACSLLTESIARMRGAYFRERLVELIETYPAGMGNAPAAQSYPRFSIGPGQRFSSKGAYIVRFSEEMSTTLELVRDWIVP